MMPTPPVAYSSLGAVIGIAVLGALVVALVAMFIGYRHWQKGKEHQHLAVAYSSGRLDGSEYVMPGELAWVGSGGAGVAGSQAPGRWGWGFCVPPWTWETRSGETEGGRKVREAGHGPPGQKHCLGPGPVSDQAGHPAPVPVPADVPPSYSHYYSNPSYHTLSQCSPKPPPPSKVSAGAGDALRGAGRRPGSLRSSIPAYYSPCPTPPLTGSRQSAVRQPPGS